MSLTQPMRSRHLGFGKNRLTTTLTSRRVAKTVRYFSVKRSVNSKGFGYANDLGPSSTEVAARDGDFRWMAGKPDLENGGRPMEYRGGEDSRARTPELPGNLQLASEPPADGVVSKTLETDLTCIHNQATWRDGSAREPAARDAHCDIQVSKNEKVVVPEHARAGEPASPPRIPGGPRRWLIRPHSSFRRIPSSVDVSVAIFDSSSAITVSPAKLKRYDSSC